MKYGKHLIALLAGCAVIVLFISPAIAFAGAPGTGAPIGCGMAGPLDRLEEQGYDVSLIRTAIESGDRETVRTLMQQFMEEHGEELDFPAPPCNGGDRLAGPLDRLEEQGYNVSEIRTAVENGDRETARTLMQQFMDEHDDELKMPTPPGDGKYGAGMKMRMKCSQTTD
jgi:hypothetical protein